MKRYMLSWLGIMTLLLAACGPAATATPTATRAAPLATATPIPSGATPSPATPAPTPAVTPTPSVAKPKYGGVLRHANRTSPEVWDAQAATGGYGDTRVQYNLVHQALFNREPPDPKPCQRYVSPDLAKRWKWVDDLTLEVEVHQGVKFHNKPPVNGREMSAEDVVFGLNRGFFIWPIRAIKGQADPLDKIVAVDRYTVRFINKRPNPGLLEAGLANQYGAVALPAGVWPPQDKWEDPYKYWIGTGPFMFKEWRSGVKSVYVRNPDYWRQGQPYLDAVEFMVMPEQTTREAAMRTGQLDLWNRELQAVSADALKNTAPQLVLQECPPLIDTSGIYLRQDKPPFNDVRVRRAFSMAIDRDGVLKAFLRGHGYIGGIWPPTHSWYLGREEYPPDVRKYLEYRPEEARKLLAEAGYADGVTITLATSPRWGMQATATVEAIVASATKAGFTVKPKFVEYAQFMASTVARKWPADENAALAPISRDNPWRDVLSFHSKGEPAENKGYAGDPEYDRLAEEFMLAVNEAKQKELIRRIQIMALDRAFWVRAPHAAAFSAHQPWVKGYNYSGDYFWGSAIFGDIWFDK